VSKAKEVNVPRESGATQLPKGHEKPCYEEGPQHTKKHEQPLRSEGTTANAKKPLVHSEQVGVTHSGRALPAETILKDSKVITSAGRLAKRNE
jgi:hypothetical protein